MILHCVPAALKDLYGAGNWKDITAFDSLFRQLDVEHHNLYFVDRICPEQYVEIVSNCTDIIVHYSYWLEAIKGLRDRFPKARVHVRAHNAEAFQHWQRENPGWIPNYRNLRTCYGFARLLAMDMACRRQSDSLLGISEWDNEYYWRFFPGKAKIHYLPYHSPWPILRPHVNPLPWSGRRNEVVCLAGGRDRIGLSQVAGFARLASYAHKDTRFNDWSFKLSPGISKGDMPGGCLGTISLMSELNEPWDLLCSVKALALLTPFGFGMKTTIVDALAAGCHVLVDDKLARRLPANVRALCQPVDLSRVDKTLSALRCILERPAFNELNFSLYEIARTSLSACLKR